MVGKLFASSFQLLESTFDGIPISMCALGEGIVGEFSAVAGSRSGQGWRECTTRRKHDSTQDIRLGASRGESEGTDSLA